MKTCMLHAHYTLLSKVTIWPEISHGRFFIFSNSFKNCLPRLSKWQPQRIFFVFFSKASLITLPSSRTREIQKPTIEPISQQVHCWPWQWRRYSLNDSHWIPGRLFTDESSFSDNGCDSLQSKKQNAATNYTIISIELWERRHWNESQ